MGLYGHLTRRSHAVKAQERSDPDEVAQTWRAVLVECSSDHEDRAAVERFPPVVNKQYPTRA